MSATDERKAGKRPPAYLLAFLSINSYKDTFDFQIGSTRSCVKTTPSLFSGGKRTIRLPVAEKEDNAIVSPRP
jgi:hypothetical protein